MPHLMSLPAGAAAAAARYVWACCATATTAACRPLPLHRCPAGAANPSLPPAARAAPHLRGWVLRGLVLRQPLPRLLARPRLLLKAVKCGGVGPLEDAAAVHHLQPVGERRWGDMHMGTAWWERINCRQGTSSAHATTLHTQVRTGAEQHNNSPKAQCKVHTAPPACLHPGVGDELELAGGGGCALAEHLLMVAPEPLHLLQCLQASGNERQNKSRN